jgi:hypothetical protein
MFIILKQRSTQPTQPTLEYNDSSREGIGIRDAEWIGTWKGADVEEIGM